MTRVGKEEDMRSELPLPVEIDKIHLFLGVQDKNLRMLRGALGVMLTPRQSRIIIEGEESKAARAVNIIERLLDTVEQEPDRFLSQLTALLMVTEEEESGRKKENAIFTERQKILPRSEGQSRHISALRSHSLTFGLGPAGSGKTYLAVACAVEALRRGAVRRIIMARPAVEAGEKLGFLPGDLQEKVDPYLRPVYDALDEMLSRKQLLQYQESGVIEVAPLAFMRGRTLSKAFVLLDEAQNATQMQMKMLLTRLGEQSRCVVTGDLTQTDLPDGGSGLSMAVRILRDIPDVAVSYLSGEDIVRHPLVKAIVEAYEGESESSKRK